MQVSATAAYKLGTVVQLNDDLTVLHSHDCAVKLLT